MRVTEVILLKSRWRFNTVQRIGSIVVGSAAMIMASVVMTAVYFTITDPLSDGIAITVVIDAIAIVVAVLIGTFGARMVNAGFRGSGIK